MPDPTRQCDPPCPDGCACSPERCPTCDFEDHRVIDCSDPFHSPERGKVASHIEWWDGPEFNARHYRHPGCRKWVVPRDDCPRPTGTRECDECARTLPVRPASPPPSPEEPKWKREGEALREEAQALSAQAPPYALALRALSWEREARDNEERALTAERKLAEAEERIRELAEIEGRWEDAYAEAQDELRRVERALEQREDERFHACEELAKAEEERDALVRILNDAKADDENWMRDLRAEAARANRAEQARDKAQAEVERLLGDEPDIREAAIRTKRELSEAQAEAEEVRNKARALILALGQAAPIVEEQTREIADALHHPAPAPEEENE